MPALTSAVVGGTTAATSFDGWLPWAISSRWSLLGRSPSRAPRWSLSSTPQPRDALVFLLLLPLWTYIASLLRLYHLQDRLFDVSSVDEIGPIALAATTWSWFFLLSRAVLEAGPIQVFLSMALWLAMIVTIPAFRSLVRAYARGRPWYHQRVAIVGRARRTSGRVARRIRRHPEYGLELALELEIDPPNDDAEGDEVDTFVRADTVARPGSSESGEGLRSLASASMDRGGRFTHRLAGEPEELAEIVASREIGRVIVASSLGDLETRGRASSGGWSSRTCTSTWCPGSRTPLSNGSSFHYLEGLPVLSVPSEPAHSGMGGAQVDSSTFWWPLWR